MTRTAYLVTGAVLLALAWTALAFFAGQRLGTTTGRADVAALRASHATELAAAQRSVVLAGEQLASGLAARDAQHRKEITDVEAETRTRTRQLLSGAVRVSVPVVQCTAPDKPGSATAGPGEARAELAPTAAADLEGIAADGDAAIIDLNACIDQYARARAAAQQLNAGMP